MSLLNGINLNDIDQTCKGCGKNLTEEIGDYLKQFNDNELNPEIDKSIELEKAKHALEINQITTKLQKEKDDLAGKLRSADRDKDSLERVLQAEHQLEIKNLEGVIKRLQDKELQISTKMIGESLEQHIEAEFTRIRATAFPNAYFEKDNDISQNSKADFIYRDYDDGKNEVLSACIECKNEAETTVKGQKNEKFLGKLHKDSEQKGCTYSILVTLCEKDNPLYKDGFVDLSHRYPNMYAVRPQFLIPLLSILKNEAFRSHNSKLKYKSEIELLQEQNLDLTKFEDNLYEFKKSFKVNRDRHHNNYTIAINSIKKAITSLETTRDALIKADDNLRIANTKIQDVTIKKLVKDSPLIAKKLSSIREAENI
tara:strand:- start:22 stop:1128 length:1107 start_codon:yes stop_codon:yes gene_type:complete